MLALIKEIDARTTSLSLFSQMIKLKDTGEEVKYIPTCCREKKNPVSGSNRIKESDDYKSIVKKFDELNDEYALKGTNLLKECAQLEVDERKKILRKEIIMSAVRLATDLARLALATLRVNQPDFIPSFTAKNYGWNVALNFFYEEFKVTWFNQSPFDTSDQVGDLISDLCKEAGNDKLSDEDNEYATPEDIQVNRSVARKLKSMYPLMSFEAWNYVREENMYRSVNQEIAVSRANQVQSEITAETEKQVTKDVPLDEETMFKMFTKFNQKLQRVKSLGGPQNQGSPNTKPGPNTSKKLEKLNGKSKGKSKVPHKATHNIPFKQSRKQRKEKSKSNVNQQQPQRKQQQNRRKQSQPKRGKGNQGGAHSERKQKSKHSQK